MQTAHRSTHITFCLRVGHSEEYADAIHKGGTRAKRYQRVHIRRTVQQSPETADKEFLIDDHHRHRQQKLHQSDSDRIAFQPRWQRQMSHHMPHRDNHQQHQKDK